MQIVWRGGGYREEAVGMFKRAWNILMLWLCQGRDWVELLYSNTFNRQLEYPLYHLLILCLVHLITIPPPRRGGAHAELHGYIFLYKNRTFESIMGRDWYRDRLLYVQCTWDMSFTYTMCYHLYWQNLQSRCVCVEGFGVDCGVPLNIWATLLLG